MIQEISKIEIIQSIREQLNVRGGDLLDEPLLAAIVRKIASTKCPCSIRTIISSTTKGLSFLNEADGLSDQSIGEVVEKLLILGDLVEFEEMLTDEHVFRQSTIFAGYPSFVCRPDGMFLIFGIVPDENSPIEAMSSRILHSGCRRILKELPGENLVTTLLDQGLFFKPDDLWLKVPKKVDAPKFVEFFDKKLNAASACGPIEGILVFCPKDGNDLYNSRWKRPSANLRGRYVTKRPTLFGFTWCYSEFSNGQLCRSIDLQTNINGLLQRQCDVGWHLGMAIDSINRSPQICNCVIDQNKEGLFEFYSPIPSWAERRLISIGEKYRSRHCLFGYAVPASEVTLYRTFLTEYLWLTLNNK